MLNDKRFEHLTKHGILVEAKRCDLKEGITLHASWHHTDADIAAATMQAIGYHAVNIHPKLNGFAGYDAVSIFVSRVNA